MDVDEKFSKIELLFCIICITIYNTNIPTEGGKIMILKLNFESEIPIYIQLRNQIVMAIAHGDLSQGDKLPTIRQLAQDLGINNMTVNKAYAMLKQEGYISIDRRHGAKVNPILTPNFEFKEKLEDDLSIVISEAEIRGVTKDEFIKICENIFDSMKGLKPERE